MRIKKLEIVGFKSFKDRTVIHFDAGITGIVGPNGCGKSNIVDALVWVMGEMSAKHLRGASMEDVIFAGAEGYAPMGLCEVSLTLENDGGAFPVQYLKHSEIMVTRRLHRSGESEYLVNREPARLRDIQEIFMDTGAGSKGFSIIEQGAIGRIVTSKPEDRRMLIEEAAGITKFKARKRESQRKLISTEQNLVRLQDIVTELKRQIDSLQRQAQRAERYRNLKREIEDLDLWLSAQHWFEVREKSQTFQAQLDEAQAAEFEMQSSGSTLSADLESIRTDLSERETRVSDLQNRHFELRAEVQKRESEIQELRFEIEQARRNKEMTGSLVQENETRKNLLEADLSRVSETLERISQEAEALRVEFANKKQMFDESSERIAEVDQELSDSRREFLTVSQGESHISARLGSLEETLNQIQEREQEAQGVLQELLEKRHEFENRRKRVFTQLEGERQMQLDIARDVETLEENKKTLTQQISEKRVEVGQCKDSLAEVTGRLYGLEDMQSNFEGFQEGVKSVMFWERQRVEQLPESERSTAAHFHPMTEVVEVPSEYELAMAAALGPRLQMLLASNTESALTAVDYLKEKHAGRSSFYSTHDRVSELDNIAYELDAPGVKAILKDVIKAPEKFKPTVARLLRHVAVVDSMSQALELRDLHPQWTFVTTEGDLLSADGVITGGTSESADSSVLKRGREIKELSVKKEEWSGRLAQAQTALRKMEATFESLTMELESAVKKNNEREVVLAGLKKDLEQAEQEVQNVQSAISRGEKEALTLSQQLLTRQSEQADLQTRLAELRERREHLESRTQELSQELLVVRSGIDGLQASVTELQVKSATKTQEQEGLRRQNEMISRSLSDVEAQLTKMTDESARSTETMSSSQVLLEEQRLVLDERIHEVQESQMQLATERDEYEKRAAQAKELEKSVSTQMSRANQIQAALNEAKLHLEQARMREVYLLDQVRERYMTHLPDVADRYKEPNEKTPASIEEAEVGLKELKEKISRIGDVNLSAIEEYDEVAKRYEFLSKQQEELIEAKEQLKKVIDRINRICSKRFRDTFEEVNSRFTKVFPVLFGGGEASLILIEDPEKGEMGIDIVAKPPGKKLQSVSLLSGGEKALTAVSLIFSIFLVKPSPYCLLDEVDAPLDDANVFRFNDLVREMSKRSQIIVVTHNKYTMEVARKLYGVTMQEKGVSKMVSVNLGDAQTVATV